MIYYILSYALLTFIISIVARHPKLDLIDKNHSTNMWCLLFWPFLAVLLLGALILGGIGAAHNKICVKIYGKPEKKPDELVDKNTQDEFVLQDDFFLDEPEELQEEPEKEDPRFLLDGGL
jgi:hypothetical protein